MTRCAACDAPMDVGQRFCLECGDRAGAPLPAALGLAPETPLPALVRAVTAESPRPPFLLPSPPVAAATVLAMLGFGVFLAAEAGPHADASLAAARAPIVLQLPAAARPAPPAAAPAVEEAAPVEAAAPVESAPLDEAPTPVEETAPPAATTPAADTPAGDDTPAATEEDAPTAPPIEHVWVLRLAEHADQLPSLADYKVQGGWLSSWKPVGDGGLADVVALLSGQEACTDPLVPCAFGPDVPTLLDQLTANDHTWRGYVEDLLVGPPTPPCTQQPPTPGAPFGAFASLAASTDCVPLAQLTTDLAPADGAKPKLPSVSLVLPGLAKIDPAVADPWLVDTIKQITATRDYGDSGLIVVELADGVLLLSPKYVNPGTTSDTPYDAYGLLHTLQDVFGLQALEKSADAPAFDDKVWTAWSQDVHEKATTS